METTVNGEPRVLATDAALALIGEIRRDHPDILFHQSGGCCDGSSPMCYPADDFMIGDSDVKLGEIGGVPVYISASQFEAWKHTQLIIDVVPGRGGMFSLDNGREKRFLTRSRLLGGGEACAIPDVTVRSV
ncbi:MULTISPECIES: DUF779 domain-containing protein [Rhizobium]|jgi:uncharacterized protein (DUF779 family)|uniref:DUF779 domain-containing protein n=1 Tax=Rhizobium anhuiense TaxID=1184720 RepID=A0A432N7Q5_9HYPH|nr:MULTISPECIES: DUF779 domain-containing protein [Rhizobium]MBB4219168.1 hypothetical protein [Rhizobium sp. BK212]MBB4254764.1 hypothetical protein [Rhizobium sp. BK008]NKM52942.1 DUF779 domain-containing protein [Rhizobium anhuiense]RUL95553.1 DUF779 domain-containing protein [Rhizobium anhuiense]UTS90883.1 DUF779 domain-containing protein [Rhizobium anhuiense bv. trifolii]